MPVQFRGKSEYNSTYKWSPSYRSAVFQPTEQQLQPDAGLRSDELNLLMEPSFTKKKPVPHRRPELQDCLVWWQDQFEPDVEEKKEKIRNKTFVVKSKPAVVKTKEEEQNERIENLKKSLSKTCSKGERKKSPVDAQNVRSKSPKEAKYEVNREKHVMRSPSRSKSSSPNKKSPKNQNGVLKPAKKYESSSDLKFDSQPVVKKVAKPQHIPLKFRSNLAIRSSHMSEYQRTYKAPTKFVPSAPYISAVDVVHHSSAAIPPHKSPKMHLRTEYESNYEPKSPLSKSLPVYTSPASPSLKLKVKNLPTSPIQQKQQKSPLKRPRSMYASQYKGREFPVETQLQLKGDAQHNKQNRDMSNFDREHLSQINSPKNRYWDVSSAEESNFTQNEENEVEEIEIEEKQNMIATKATSVESVKGSDTDRYSVESEETMEKDSLDVQLDEKSTYLRDVEELRPVARKLAWGEESEENDGDDDATSTVTLTNEETDNILEGRLPTPQLKGLGGGLRSHHDLTTPCKGGALLTSPPHRTNSRVSSLSSCSVATLVDSLDLPQRQRPVVMNKTKKVEPKSSKMQNTFLKTTPQVLPSKKAPLPRRMIKSPRAPIQGTLRNQEFQHCGRNVRPLGYSNVDNLSMLSARSAASAKDLLDRSMARSDFWSQK